MTSAGIPSRITKTALGSPATVVEAQHKATTLHQSVATDDSARAIPPDAALWMLGNRISRVGRPSRSCGLLVAEFSDSFILRLLVLTPALIMPTVDHGAIVSLPKSFAPTAEIINHRRAPDNAA